VSRTVRKLGCRNNGVWETYVTMHLLFIKSCLIRTRKVSCMQAGSFIKLANYYIERGRSCSALHFNIIYEMTGPNTRFYCVAKVCIFRLRLTDYYISSNQIKVFWYVSVELFSIIFICVLSFLFATRPDYISNNSIRY
jgi:hypothetical protein